MAAPAVVAPRSGDQDLAGTKKCRRVASANQGYLRIAASIIPDAHGWVGEFTWSPPHQNIAVAEQGGRGSRSSGIQARSQHPVTLGGIVELGAGEQSVCAVGKVDAAGDQRLSARQQRGRRAVARNIQGSGSSPSTLGGVVKLRAGQRISVKGGDFPSRDQHLAIRKQCRVMVTTGSRHATGGCPSPRGRVVEFGGGTARGEIGGPAGDQHLAIREQRRGMIGAAGVHAAGSCPYAGSRIVQLGAGEWSC